MGKNDLKAKRLQRGLTLDEIHVRTGGRVHQSRLSRAERGLLRLLPGELAALAQVFGVDPDELMDSTHSAVPGPGDESR
ncbi:MAG: helix-turn-helix transcriptional regulator [Acidobacteria bacterium]|nr:helix-turn-helix transcriptional regulator [Acidobacteriota bacterium]